MNRQPYPEPPRVPEIPKRGNLYSYVESAYGSIGIIMAILSFFSFYVYPEVSGVFSIGGGIFFGIVALWMLWKSFVQFPRRKKEYTEAMAKYERDCERFRRETIEYQKDKAEYEAELLAEILNGRHNG